MIGIAHSSPSVSGSIDLVRRDEPAEGLGVHAPVAMRDHLQREVIDARQCTRGSLCKARKSLAVTLGQVLPGRADLFFDQVEIVEQPFAGRRNAPP